MALRTGPTSVGEEAITLRILAAPGLVRQRLGQVAGLGLHLIEQPHILDRDRRLVGEGRGQLDLLVGEGAARSIVTMFRCLGWRLALSLVADRKGGRGGGQFLLQFPSSASGSHKALVMAGPNAAG